MGTMNVSLPDNLKAYVDQQVQQAGYGTSSEFIRDLIRRDQDRTRLRSLLLEGAASPPMQEAGAEFFEVLRAQARKGAST